MLEQAPFSFGPTASVAQLKKRAQLLHGLRAFFYEHDIIEVDAPCLGRSSVTDPYLEGLKVGVGAEQWFLQTSPEFYLKRLLAAGMPSLYSLGKAYRQDEMGRRHRAEFTLLEWYCLGMDDQALIAQMTQLLHRLAPEQAVEALSYGALFQRVLSICPYRASITQLQKLAREHAHFEGALANKSAWLDLLFSHCVEPTLKNGFTFVFDYPFEQSALARVCKNAEGIAVAKRFELFGRGIELANGYWELTDAKEQRLRFEADLAVRQQQGLPLPAIDERFMAAMESGLPACAGVALGVDRLLMVLAECEDIAQVMPFANG